MDQKSHGDRKSQPSRKDGTSHQQKLDYIIAGSTNLRRHVDALQEASNDPSLLGEADFAEDTKQTLAYIQELLVDVQPFSDMVEEFKAKWQWQKEQLLVQKKQEIETHLRRQDEKAQEKINKEAESELAAIASEEENLTNSAAAARIKDIEPTLRLAVDDWKAEVRGADLVNNADIERALRMSLSRIAAWTSEQERRLSAEWKEAMRQLVLDIHRLDQDTLTYIQQSQVGRQTLVDDLLARHRKELVSIQQAVQGDLTAVYNSLFPSERAVERKRDEKAERRLALTAAQKHAKVRIDNARQEASAALESHIASACAHLDREASQEAMNRQYMREVVQEVGPALEAQLDAALKKIVDQLRTQKSKSVANFGGSSDGSSATSGPGRGPARGISRLKPEGAEDSSGSESSAHEQDQSRERTDSLKKISELRAKLSDALAAISKGSWSGTDWHEDVEASARSGHDLLSSANSSLEAMAASFGNAEEMQPDEQLVSSCSSFIASETRAFAERAHMSFDRLKNVKLALSRDRQGTLIRLSSQYNRALHTEDEILRYISKIAHEVETIQEVAYALERGSDVLPVGVVAGSWRRTIAATLSAVMHLWQATGASPAHKRQLLVRLLAVIARSPSTAHFVSQGIP